MAKTETQEQVTPEILRELLDYDPETGLLTWKERSPKFFRATSFRSAEGCANNWNSKNAGQKAFTSVNFQGYHEGGVFRRTFLAHRVIYALMTGSWPAHQIDHIDGCRTNNKWSNLRPCTRTQNNRNTKPYGASGFIGVHKTSHPGSYSAAIYADGVLHYIGGGRDPAALARLRDEKAKELHGEFARLNFPDE